MNFIGQPFIELASVESSNNYATTQVQAALAEHGTAWFAHNQTKGKGQRGKTWLTEPGANIILTTIIEPAGASIKEQFILSAAMANACFSFFALYAGDETSIKWPNDIYWRDRKAGGILIENIIQGNHWKYVIVGIGMNINQTTFPEGLKNPVSLKQITGKTFSTVGLAKELCTHLQSKWEQFEQGNYEIILSNYNSSLFRLNEQVDFAFAQQANTYSVKGVNRSGELIIENQCGATKSIKFGEAEWII